MIEFVFTVMMVISCDLKAFNELEWDALNNSSSVEEMLEKDIRSFMRRHYYAVKIKNIMAHKQLKDIRDTRNS